MSEDQDAQNIDALVDAFNDASFEGMENPRGELNDLYREQTDHTIVWSDNIRNDFDQAYNRNRNALRHSLIGVIRFSNDRLRRRGEEDTSQNDNTDERIRQNRELIESLTSLWSP